MFWQYHRIVTHGRCYSFALYQSSVTSVSCFYFCQKYALMSFIPICPLRCLRTGYRAVWQERGAAGCISLTGTRGLSLAYHLRQGSPWGSRHTRNEGAEQDHGDQTKDGGGQHDAVESECKLGHPQRHAVSMIRLMVPGRRKVHKDRHSSSGPRRP